MDWEFIRAQVIGWTIVVGSIVSLILDYLESRKGGA